MAKLTVQQFVDLAKKDLEEFVEEHRQVYGDKKLSLYDFDLAFGEFVGIKRELEAHHGKKRSK